MNRTEPGPLAAALTGDQFKPTVVLFTAPLIVLTWKHFGSTEFYVQRLAPCVVLVAYLASEAPAVVEEYPINRKAGTSPGMFGVHACTYVLFYLGWDSFSEGSCRAGCASDRLDFVAHRQTLERDLRFHRRGYPMGRPPF